MSTRPLLALFAAALIGSQAGCSVFVRLPTTPRLEGLSEAQVFAMAPAPEWPEPQAESPSTAAVEVACGVGPRLRSGAIYAAVSVRGRQAPAAVAPLNVALVLDRSGSMSGAPFRNMLTAAQAFLSQLRDGDRVSVVAFSNGVFEVVPPVVIDAGTRAAATGNVAALANGGGTFMSGGILAGLAEVFSAFDPWQLNQVVLLSDGQPNIGVTSPEELAAIGQRAAERGVAITTIGFGQDHDELLMQGIADASGGTYYFVEKASDIPAIFQREAGEMLRTAARSTDIALEVPPGLTVEDVPGYDFVVADGVVWIRVGSIPHGEDRYAVLKLRAAMAGQGALNTSVIYSDLARRGRFAVGCAPGWDARVGGQEPWALELGGRAEAAWGLLEATGWADGGNDVFAISQLAYTRGILADMRAILGADALADEDAMLVDAQATLGLKMAAGAAHAASRGGLKGLLRFGVNQAAQTAAAGVALAIDPRFRPRTRVAVQVNFHGRPAQRYGARHAKYKARDRDASLRYKRARFRTYRMMRVRGARPRAR